MISYHIILGILTYLEAMVKTAPKIITPIIIPEYVLAISDKSKEPNCSKLNAKTNKATANAPKEDK